MIIAPGATSQSIQVQIVDDTGLPVTGLVAATFPTTYYSRAAETLPSAISLSDLAAQNSAYSSGGVKELAGGYYRLDVPNAAFATASKVRIIGEATGKRVLYPVITVANLPADVQSMLAAVCNKVADHLKRRTQANTEASSDGDALDLLSLYGMVQQAQESDLTTTPGTQTVFKTDGTTVLGTRAVTSDAAAEPVTGVS